MYEALVSRLPDLFRASTAGAIKFVDTSSHGFLTVGFDAAAAHATFTLIPASEVVTDYSKQPPGALDNLLQSVSFDIVNGTLSPA